MKIIECPRDAMQGLVEFIATENKIRYLNQLLKVGFDTLDFGSFVSEKAIPQMKDTTAVLNDLNWHESKTSLLAIVANVRGAEVAAAFEGVQYLGFPLSISETFQRRNTNKSIVDALNTLADIQNICVAKNKRLVTYISMGFGNPYGDPYEPSLVSQFIDIVNTVGCNIISLSDTIGAATPETIREIFKPLPHQYATIEFGVHLHSSPLHALEKIKAAYESGCRRFDGALKGYGGCPMADDELIGNMATETIIAYLNSVGENTAIDQDELSKAMVMADQIFPKH